MEAATAQMAFFGPRRLRRRRNWAWKSRSFWRLAAQAHWMSTVLSHGAPLRRREDRREDRRLPALSSWRGHSPAQDTRWPAVGKRLMSRPISARIIRAAKGPMPGIVSRRLIRAVKEA